MGGWSGLRVLVMGLGTKHGGTESARFAVAQGAQVTVTDLAGPERFTAQLAELAGLPLTFRLGGHEADDFRGADIVIKNPGIRPDHPLLVLARAHGATVTDPLLLFAERDLRPLIGITGTKGKSLTTHLAAHLLTAAGIPALAAGNNCVSPLSCLDVPERQPVLELSSWQLRDLGAAGRSPKVACWLNFFSDHADHYPDREEYFRDKEQILVHQQPDDTAILPAEDPRLAALPVRGHRVLFSGERGVAEGWGYDGERLVRCRAGTEVFSFPLNGLAAALYPGHWRANIAAACAVAEVAGAGTELTAGLASFPGLAHRMELLPAPRGYVIINDSAASTPESALLALAEVRQRPLALIAGGGGVKNLDLAGFAAAAAGAELLILFRDDPASEALRTFPEVAGKPGLQCAATMEEAVETGLAFLRRAGGGTLLLSPGCSGAPFFPDMFVRGELFRAAVAAAGGGP